jgi:hypothetical protein
MHIGGVIDEGGARLVRHGRDVELRWSYGTEILAPLQGQTVFEDYVDVDKFGYIYGYEITSTHDNSMLLFWSAGTTTQSIHIPLQSKGSTYVTLPVALNEGYPISYNDVATGGSKPGFYAVASFGTDGIPGSKCNVSILIGEVPR